MNPIRNLGPAIITGRLKLQWVSRTNNNNPLNTCSVNNYDENRRYVKR